ncbi:MAG: decaprenyl-phosphate phosphoribosyltransferase [Thermoanaerobaculia bacterium]
MKRPLFRAMRPIQWVKNVFVLAPVVFAEQALQVEVMARALLAFLVFCCAASAIYLVNDIRDREEDRRHPQKRHRPIAAGELSVAAAASAAILLAAAGVAGALVLGTRFLLLLTLYLAINLLYSSGGLKKVVILDVMAVASGYVLRVMAGGAAVGVAISNWLLLCTTFLALLMILSKRRHEILLLADTAAEHRSVLSHYSPQFLDQLVNVVTASAVVSYALYAVDDDTVARFGSDNLVYTVPLVLFGIFRYLYLTYQKAEKRNPTEAILFDPPSLANLLLWGLSVVWIVYG